MSEPFLSEIKMMSFNFPPKGWALCDGQVLPINQNQALFSLVGTTYGGDGRTTFALPDLRGRTPIHFDSSHSLGQKGGSEAVTLSGNQMPQHSHALEATDSAGTATTPTGNLLANAPALVYGPLTEPTPLGNGSVGNVGGGQPHDNIQPYLTLNFCIALQGIFPSRN